MDAQDLDRTTRTLLDVNQVAARMCVTPRFIRRLVEERRIPFCRLGKFVRFDPADIEAWIEARRVEPAS
jgi:excisionase family DNA binding protein